MQWFQWQSKFLTRLLASCTDFARDLGSEPLIFGADAVSGTWQEIPTMGRRGVFDPT